jgi:hypothetical protein
MQIITTIGLGIATSMFQVHGVDANGHFLLTGLRRIRPASGCRDSQRRNLAHAPFTRPGNSVQTNRASHFPHHRRWRLEGSNDLITAL